MKYKEMEDRDSVLVSIFGDKVFRPLRSWFENRKSENGQCLIANENVCLFDVCGRCGVLHSI